MGDNVERVRADPMEKVVVSLVHPVRVLPQFKTKAGSDIAKLDSGLDDLEVLESHTLTIDDWEGLVIPEFLWDDFPSIIISENRDNEQLGSVASIVTLQHEGGSRGWKALFRDHRLPGIRELQ